MVICLGAKSHGLLERSGTSWHDHEFLNLEAVSSMSTTIDDVERWNRGHELVSALASELGQVVVKRNVLGICASSGNCERHSQNGVCADLLLAPAPLILSAIDLLDHLAIDLLLLSDIHALESGMKEVMNVFNGLKASLAHISFLILVSEFKSLVDTS